MQSLLNILCPLIRDKKTVSFPNASFVQGSTIFADYGFDVRYRNKDCDVIYVSPAHMTKWGEIMPVSRRMELVHHAAENGSLIIEDDYENEFVYFQRPTPSLFNLAGGHGVVYIWLFLPSAAPVHPLKFYGPAAFSVQTIRWRSPSDTARPPLKLNRLRSVSSYVTDI